VAIAWRKEPEKAGNKRAFNSSERIYDATRGDAVRLDGVNLRALASHALPEGRRPDPSPVRIGLYALLFLFAAGPIVSVALLGIAPLLFGARGVHDDMLQSLANARDWFNEWVAVLTVVATAAFAWWPKYPRGSRIRMVAATLLTVVVALYATEWLVLGVPVLGAGDGILFQTLRLVSSAAGCWYVGELFGANGKTQLARQAKFLAVIVPCADYFSASPLANRFGEAAPNFDVADGQLSATFLVVLAISSVARIWMWTLMYRLRNTSI
jgi:hypothetical protein